MKISKRRLRQIIKEERAKLESSELLNEEAKGAPSIGFAGWAPNRRPDFAKAYGRDARVIGQYHNNNNDLTEQPLPAPSSSHKDNAFQTLKLGGAFKDLQEMMHDCTLEIEEWQTKHADDAESADLTTLLVDLQDAWDILDGIRQTAIQPR